MRRYLITGDAGLRTWHADDYDHARKQHENAFPDERIEAIWMMADE